MSSLVSTSSLCCTRCRTMLKSGCEVSIFLLQSTALECELCGLLLSSLQERGKDLYEQIHISTQSSALVIKKGKERLLNLLCDLGEFVSISMIPVDLTLDFGSDIQVTHLGYLSGSDPIESGLLLAWLDNCNRRHKCRPSRSIIPRKKPTRLLDVGHDDPNKVSLYLPAGIRNLDYIALSHCWGDNSNQFKTTDSNYRLRLKGFAIDKLPRTFQDAIYITRKLGKRYLWIDSLCIIQDQKDGKDFKIESKRMETVYSSAYCTLAATSAVDSSQGFLARRPQSHHVTVDDGEGHQIHVSTDLYDFDEDVEQAVLNTRGWVLQERILSRRTIHFSANHIYWQCGDGISCESLLALKR